MRGQCVAQRALAVPGQRKEVVLAEVEQRALQRHRQRQIVLRQQQGVRKIHQVDDRYVFGEFQAIGAGHGNTGVFQRLNDGVEQVAAPAHQHQHVAIGETPAVAVAAGHGAISHHPPDLGLDALRQFDFG